MKDQKSVLSQAIQSQIYIHAREAKLLIWSELQRGGCIQTKGQLELRSDGGGTWSCITRSRNPFPGDIWHADFAVQDRNGAVLFGLGPFYSPRMCVDPEMHEYRWSAPFSFSADLFPAIHAAVQNCGTLPPICVLNVSASKPAARQQVVAENVWHRMNMSRILEAYA